MKSADEGMVVGVDVGGTKVALIARDVASGNDVAHERFATPREGGPEALARTLVERAHALLQGAGRDPGALRALGVAMPGIVDDEGVVRAAGNLDGFAHVPLRAMLHDALGVPVFVEQDANAAALGERWVGCARALSNFVFVALGTGVGAGLVINGRLHRGAHFAAGELGNLITGREHLGGGEHPPRSLAMLIGGRVIRARARRAAGQPLSAGEALERAAGDERLDALADDIADDLSIAVIALAVALDPQAVIFGGGTAAHELIDRVRERVERALPVRPELLRSALGEDAQLHGAVFGALWQLDPALALREELR